MATLKILGLSGSFRAASFNTAALRVCASLMPAGMTLDIYDYRDVPLFDGDVFAKGNPPSVVKIREAVRAADGVLFASPEYNFSVSGVLKNAIDWLSRGADQPFMNKPYAIVSATQGPLGGARSQYDLRKIMTSINAHGLNKPEIFIGMAQNKFDASGKVTDEATLKIMGDQMKAFHDYVVMIKRGLGQQV